MSSQPKEYLCFVGARIVDEDFVRMKKWCEDNGKSVADAIRMLVRNGFAHIELSSTELHNIDVLRCYNHEARKRYSRKNGSP